MNVNINPLKWFPGWKTRTAGLALILTGLGGLLGTPEVWAFPAIFSNPDFVKIVEGVGLLGLREAISNGATAKLG